MQASKPKPHWNELEFLSWKEFQQMAPSIIQLEISRIGKIINASQTQIDFHNALVKARFELEKFVECLANATKGQLEDACAPHIQTAIINLSVNHPELDDKTQKTLGYINDRLNSILDRIGLIY